MDTQKHPNSHIVFFRRAPMFASGSRKELEEYFSESHTGIGSYFTKGGQRTATGLTITEENLLMPYIINIPETDRDFRGAVTTYFQNIETKVPAAKTNANGVVEGGKALEIGLEKDNSLPVSKDNLPLNIEDYIRYNQGMGHPHMAADEAEGKSMLKRYFLYDPEAVSTSNIGINDQKDKAFTQYLIIKDKPTKVNMYLTLLGVNIAQLKRGEEQMKLRSLADKDPAKFLAVFEDKDKEMKYIIEDMINNKILERIGKDNIMVPEKDGGELIGRSMREAVLYLKDATNSRMFNVLKAKQQEAWKKLSISVDTDEDLELEPVGAEAVAAPEPKKVDKKVPDAAGSALGDVE